MESKELKAIQTMIWQEARSFQKTAEQSEREGHGRECTALRAGMAALDRMSAWIAEGYHWEFTDEPKEKAE